MKKTHTDVTSPSSRLILRATLFRFALFALLWWGLTEGRMASPGLALAAVALTTLTSLLFVPPGSWSLRLFGLIRFLPYFLFESLVAGLDVSRRALTPRLPVTPSIFQYQLTLSSRAGRIFLVWIVSLLPGTASIDLDADCLTVHVLVDHLPHEERIRGLERRIGKLFGEPEAD